MSEFLTKLYSTDHNITYRNIVKFRRGAVVSSQNPLQKHKPVHNDLRKDQKISTSPGGTEKIVWNRCSYQVPAMVGTNNSTKENQKLYNPKVQAISI